MRLTAERDPETIKRYAHIKPARKWGSTPCSARCPGTSRSCTLAAGHRGPHVAHAAFGKVVAVWDGDTDVRTSVGRLRSSLEARAETGLRKEKPTTSLAALLRQMLPTSFSVEEAAFIALFLVIVGLAFYWLFLLFRASVHLV